MLKEIQCCSCFQYFEEIFIVVDEFLVEENHHETICINCAGGEVWDYIELSKSYEPQTAQEYLTELRLNDKAKADLFESVDDAQGQRNEDPFAHAVSAVQWDEDDLPF